MKNKAFLPDDYIATYRKELSIEEVVDFAKKLQMRPPSKVDDLAKLFRPYLTGEIHDKLVADGKMPVGVVLNSSKIKDDEFLKLAVYSLDKYFNLRWICSGSPEADAVTFVFIEAGFYAVHDIEMKRHISPADLYQLYPLNP